MSSHLPIDNYSLSLSIPSSTPHSTSLPLLKTPSTTITQGLITQYLSEASIENPRTRGLDRFHAYRVLYQLQHGLHNHPHFKKFNINLLQTPLFFANRCNYLSPALGAANHTEKLVVKGQVGSKAVQKTWEKITAIPSRALTTPTISDFITAPPKMVKADVIGAQPSCSQVMVTNTGNSATALTTTISQQPIQSAKTTILSQCPAQDTAAQSGRTLEEPVRLAKWPNESHSVNPIANRGRAKDTPPVILRPSVDYYVIIDYECTCLVRPEHLEWKGRGTSNNNNSNNNNNDKKTNTFNNNSSVDHSTATPSAIATTSAVSSVSTAPTTAPAVPLNQTTTLITPTLESPSTSQTDSETHGKTSTVRRGKGGKRGYQPPKGNNININNSTNNNNSHKTDLDLQAMINSSSVSDPNNNSAWSSPVHPVDAIPLNTTATSSSQLSSPNVTTSNHDSKHDILNTSLDLLNTTSLDHQYGSDIPQNNSTNNINNSADKNTNNSGDKDINNSTNGPSDQNTSIFSTPTNPPSGATDPPLGTSEFERFIQEIIEFPAILVNAHDLTVVSVFHSYVKPTINPILSDFCKDLTKITQEQVDAAPPLDVVLVLFVRWLMAYGVVFHSSLVDFGKELSVFSTNSTLPAAPSTQLAEMANNGVVSSSVHNTNTATNDNKTNNNDDNIVTFEPNTNNNQTHSASSPLLPNLSNDSTLTELINGDVDLRYDSDADTSMSYVNYNKLDEFTFTLNHPEYIQPNASYPGSITSGRQTETIAIPTTLTSTITTTAHSPLSLSQQMSLVDKLMNNLLETKSSSNDAPSLMMSKMIPQWEANLDINTTKFSHFDYYLNTILSMTDLIVATKESTCNNVGTKTPTCESKTAQYFDALFDEILTKFSHSTIIINSQITPHHIPQIPPLLSHPHLSAPTRHSSCLLISDGPVDFLGFLIPECQAKGMSWILTFLFGVSSTTPLTPFSIPSAKFSSELDPEGQKGVVDAVVEGADGLSSLSLQSSTQGGLSSLPSPGQGSVLPLSSPATPSTTIPITPVANNFFLNALQYRDLSVVKVQTPPYFDILNKTKFIAHSQLYFCNIRHILYQLSINSRKTDVKSSNNDAIYLQLPAPIMLPPETHTDNHNNDSAYVSKQQNGVKLLTPPFLTNLFPDYTRNKLRHFPITTTPSLLPQLIPQSYQPNKQQAMITSFLFKQNSTLPFKLFIGKYEGGGLPHFLKILNMKFIGQLHCGLVDSLNITRLMYHILFMSDYPLSYTGIGQI